MITNQMRRQLIGQAKKQSERDMQQRQADYEQEQYEKAQAEQFEREQRLANLRNNIVGVVDKLKKKR